MVPVAVRKLCPAGGGRGVGLTLVVAVGVLRSLVAGCGARHPRALNSAAHEEAPAPPPPVAVITPDPSDHATGLSPLTPVTVTVKKGKLGKVTLTNAQGTSVAG